MAGDLPCNVPQALRLIAQGSFRPLDDADAMAFAGVCRRSALIADVGDLVVVVAGAKAGFYAPGGDWVEFQLIVASSEVVS